MRVPLIRSLLATLVLAAPAGAADVIDSPPLAYGRRPPPLVAPFGCVATMRVPTNGPDDPSYVGSSMGLGRPSYHGNPPGPGLDDPYGRRPKPC